MAQAGHNPARQPDYGDEPTDQERVWIDMQRSRKIDGYLRELSLGIACDCCEENPRTGELRLDANYWGL